MNHSITSVIGAGVGTIALTWYLLQSTQGNTPLCPPPTQEWHHIGKLKEISLYPLKGGAGVVLENAECDKYGLFSMNFWDHRLFLMNDDDETITASVHPIMLSIKPKIISNDVILMEAAESIEPLKLNISKLIKKGTKVDQNKVGNFVKIVECRSKEHEWFSKVILNRKKGLRLYIVVDRHPDGCWWGNTSLWTHSTMAIQDKSIEDLNKRLSDLDQVTYKQFHSNLFIETLNLVEPYDEDKWMWMRIGHNAILKYMSICSHNISININPDTCERNRHFQPLRELREYRSRQYSSMAPMGGYYDIYQPGFVTAGDLVYVKHKY